MSGARRGSGEGGFTLLEVLTVVAIMSVLASLMIYGMGVYRQRAMITGSTAVVTKLRAGLDAYYNTYRRYPPDGYDSVVRRTAKGGAATVKGSQCLIQYLGLPTVQEVEIGQDVRVQEIKPFLELTADMLSGEGDLDERLDDPATLIVDSFGNPIHYDNVELDPSGKPQVNEQTDQHVEAGVGAMVPAPDPRKSTSSGGGSGGAKSGGSGGLQPKNKGAYDVWSHGPKIADPSDDIGNW